MVDLQTAIGLSDHSRIGSYPLFVCKKKMEGEREHQTDEEHRWISESNWRVAKQKCSQKERGETNGGLSETQRRQRHAADERS